MLNLAQWIIQSRSGVQLHIILPSAFLPRGIHPAARCIRESVGLTVGLDPLGKRKMFCTCWELNHISWAVHSEAWPQYRSFATRLSQLKIWHFWVIGIGRNFCRCTFIRYSVITQSSKLAVGEQLCRLCTHRKL